MTVDFQGTARTDQTKRRQWGSDRDPQRAYAGPVDLLDVNILRIIAGQRSGDQGNCPLLRVGGTAIGQGSVAGTGPCGVDKCVADMQNQGQLHDGHKNQGEDSADQHEVHAC